MHDNSNHPFHYLLNTLLYLENLNCSEPLGNTMHQLVNFALLHFLCFCSNFSEYIAVMCQYPIVRLVISMDVDIALLEVQTEALYIA